MEYNDLPTHYDDIDSLILPTYSLLDEKEEEEVYCCSYLIKYFRN